MEKIRSDEEKRTNLKELTRRAKRRNPKAEAQKAENVQEQKTESRKQKMFRNKSDTSQIWNRYCDIGRRYDGSRIPKLRKETILSRHFRRSR